MPFKIHTIILCLLLVASSFAQVSTAAPFNSIGISAGYNQNRSIDDLNEFWDVDYGGSLNFETTFYFGHVSLGIDYTKFSSNNLVQPDFNSIYVSMKLSKKLELFLGTKLSAGIKFGTFVMSFDVTNSTEFETTESELAIGAQIKYEIPVVTKFSLFISTDFTTVFTNKRLKLWDTSAGLIYEFDSPFWFKEFFK